MRLSSLSLAAVLLLSLVALAQHHDTPAPAPPPPPPPPVAAPSPAPSFTPSVPSIPAAPASRATAPSAPSSPAPPAPAAHAPDMNHAVPEQRITDEEKGQAALRTSEEEHPGVTAKDVPEKEKEAKAADPDLRRGICGDKPCEQPEPKPVEPEKDGKHRRPCVKEPCACPPGDRTPEGGCVATVVENNAARCQPGQVWSGGACIAISCPPNESWDGTRCVPLMDQCAATAGAAARLIEQLRALKAEMTQACMQDPAGQTCLDLTQRHELLRQEYRLLWNQASPICRSRLPEPDSL